MGVKKMENNLKSGLMRRANMTTTENGRMALKSTGSGLLDLYAVGGSIRHKSMGYKLLKFEEAFAEDRLLAVKLLFHIRDIRGGVGERQTFRDILGDLANMHPDIVIKNMHLIPFYGRYDDLYCLIGTDAEDAMWGFMRATYEDDLVRMGRGESISLMAKWVANPSSKSRGTSRLGRKTIEKMGFKKQGYVTCCKNLATMRKYLAVPEIAIAAKRYDLLDYSKIAGKCMLLHRKLFSKNDSIRFEEYIQAVNNGEQKINTGTLTPGDILRKYWVGKNWNLPARDKDVQILQTLWDKLIDYTGESSALVMLDVSASMTWYGGDPIVNGMGLAIYCAQRCEGPFKNCLMTFSSEPHFLDISGLSLAGAIRKIMDARVLQNTDVMKAYKLILQTAIDNQVSQEDMPNAIVLVSDMQFDNCDEEFTMSEELGNMFSRAGYKAPELIMWDVRGEDTMQATKDDSGVTLVSGASAIAFQNVMDAVRMTPYERMLQVLTSDRYAAITV